MQNLNQSQKIICAVAFGAIVGSLMGVLFAPDKGCVTRDKLSGKTKRYDEELLKRLKDDIIAFRHRANQLEKVLNNKKNPIT